MRRFVRALVLAATFAAVGLQGCKGSSGGGSQTCQGNVGDTCTLPTLGGLACCTGICDGATCQQQCSGNLNDTCTAGGAPCCEGSCDATGHCSAGTTWVATGGGCRGGK